VQSGLRTTSCLALIGLGLVGGSACERRLVSRPDGGSLPRDAGTAGERPVDGGAGFHNAGDASPRCNRSSVVLPLGTTHAIDLLFAIDDSSSMASEQAALSAQFPRLIARLSSAVQGRARSAPSLHLGVVSSDLGIDGVTGVPTCEGRGDDGLLQHAADPQLDACAQSYPPFLAFSAGVDDAQRITTDLGCVASLGTNGCGLPQPLESVLRALWPDGVARGLSDSRLGGVIAGTHGRTENAGFLRDGVVAGDRALLAIVVVTDKDDCSAREPSQLTLDWSSVEPSDAIDRFATLCMRTPQALFPSDRYAATFAALRTDRTQPLMFAAIAGVPPELVTAGKLALVDFSNEQARFNFYGQLLSHPKMQTELVPAGERGVADDIVSASCEGAHGSARPPQRIVEVAMALGEHSLVQSICASDFGPALDTIAGRIADAFEDGCLADPLLRDEHGLVACEVTWTLPPPLLQLPESPASCDDERFPFLLPALQASRVPVLAQGERCRVAQLAVATRDGRASPVTTRHGGRDFERGWFYDDFSADVAASCPQRPRRIALSDGLVTPRDVVLGFECWPRAFDVNGAERCSDGEEDARP
jgi:hypothetical protein